MYQSAYVILFHFWHNSQQIKLYLACRITFDMKLLLYILLSDLVCTLAFNDFASTNPLKEIVLFQLILSLNQFLKCHILSFCVVFYFSNHPHVANGFYHRYVVCVQVFVCGFRWSRIIFLNVNEISFCIYMYVQEKHELFQNVSLQYFLQI